MFSNGRSILVQPIQRDDLIQNQIDCRIIDVQQKISDLLTAGYTIYDVSAATNSNFNNLIASSSGNRICIWKDVGSTAYTLYSTELASNGTNIIINAKLNNMNLVTEIRDCALTCSASSGLFVNKVEFYGGDWYLASWTTGSNVKFTNCNVHAYTSEIYMPDVNFDYCNVSFKKSGTLAYSTYKENKDTVFVNETTAGSTAIILTMSYSYTTTSDWFTRVTIKDFQNTGSPVLSSTVSRVLNFTGLKLENSNLTITNLYSTNGSKIYYEGQDLVLSGSITGYVWSQVGSTNVSSSSGLYPSLAFNQSGVPYVAFQDNSTGSAGKTTCMKYGSTGWQTVGYNAFSSNTMDYISLCISTDNDIIIVGRDNSSKATAYYFSAAASSWNLLGSAGFNSDSTSIIKQVNADYYYNNGNKYISSVTIHSSSETGYRKRSYIYPLSTGSNWFDVKFNYGSANSSALASLYKNYIYYSEQTAPTAVYIEQLTNTTSATYITNIVSSTGVINNIFSGDHCFGIIDETSGISCYLHSESSALLIGYKQFTTGTVQNADIENIANIYHVSVEDTTSKATCYKYITANSSWNLVGTAQFSTDTIGRLQLAQYNNEPYLVVEEKAAPGIALYKFVEASQNSNVNYNFENLDTDIFDGEYVLDIATIQSSSNYIVQNCKVRPGYNIVNTAVGSFIRNTYNIELAPGWNPTVDESLKKANADTFWVVKREDIESTLDGMIIKNLKLYDSGLNLYDYKSNDNFIIIANNASKGNAVFCFYNNKVKGTVFSDAYLDVSYTITDCIILMEVNEISEMQNIVSSTICPDGPLENGSILFGSYDNEIIV